MGFFGVLFMVIGFIGGMIGVSTSIDVDTGYGKVANLSLMHQQQVLVITSGFLILAGSVLYAAYLLRLAMEEKMMEHARIAVGGADALNARIEEKEVKRVADKRINIFWALFLGAIMVLVYIGNFVNSGS